MPSVKMGRQILCPASVFLAETVLICQSVARNQLKSSHFPAKIALFAVSSLLKFEPGLTVDYMRNQAYAAAATP
jgi:hypothetical protein